jgi:hypothetical protein
MYHLKMAPIKLKYGTNTQQDAFLKEKGNLPCKSLLDTVCKFGEDVTHLKSDKALLISQL